MCTTFCSAQKAAAFLFRQETRRGLFIVLFRTIRIYTIFILNPLYYVHYFLSRTESSKELDFLFYFISSFLRCL